MDEIDLRVVYFRLSSVFIANDPSKTSCSRLEFICVPAMTSRKSKMSKNYHGMRRLCRLDKREKSAEEDK
jgi:hypothetical protein